MRFNFSLAALALVGLSVAISNETAPTRVEARSIEKRDLSIADIGVFALLGTGTISQTQCAVGQGVATAGLRLSALSLVQVCACVKVLSFTDPSVTPCPTCGPLGSTICNSGCACSCVDNAVQVNGQCTVCRPGFHIDTTGLRCVADPVCPVNSAAVCNAGNCVCVCNVGFNPVPGETPLRCALAPSPAARARLAKKWVKKSTSVCPETNISCPLSTGGSECVDANAIEHCGSCDNNCDLLPGAKNTGCADGACHIFSCTRGYHLINNECISIFESRKRK